MSISFKTIKIGLALAFIILLPLSVLAHTQDLGTELNLELDRESQETGTKLDMDLSGSDQKLGDTLDLELLADEEFFLPTVRTESATNINVEKGTAVLNGTLLSLGRKNEAEVWFKWGENKDSLVETKKEIKTEATTFSKEVQGVELERTYYFKAMAENEEGVSEGALLDFTATEREGDIIIRYGDEEKTIEIFEDGRIEIIN